MGAAGADSIAPNRIGHVTAKPVILIAANDSILDRGAEEPSVQIPEDPMLVREGTTTVVADPAGEAMSAVSSAADLVYATPAGAHSSGFNVSTTRAASHGDPRINVAQVSDIAPCSMSVLEVRKAETTADVAIDGAVTSTQDRLAIGKSQASVPPTLCLGRWATELEFESKQASVAEAGAESSQKPSGREFSKQPAAEVVDSDDDINALEGLAEWDSEFRCDLQRDSDGSDDTVLDLS